MKKNILNPRVWEKFIALLLVMAINLLFITPSYAAALTSLSDTMSRLKVSENSDHTIKFTTPTGAGDVGDTITIAFPSDFSTTSVDYTDIDLSYGASTGAETDATLAAAADATSWGAAFGGTGSRTLTLTHPTNASNGDIAASDKVIVEIGTVATGGVANAQIDNPTTNATFIIDIAGTFGDTGSIAVAILTEDQIPVTASVNPTITFTVATTTLALGILDSGVIRTTTANNIAVGTNGSGGYTVTIKGAGSGSGDGLYNAPAAKLISSTAATLSTGAEGYGAQCQTSGSPSGSCAAGYNYWATEQVGEVGLSYATFASYGAKPAATDTFQIRVKASIATTTDAGAYADTITVIGTANF